MLTRVIFLLSLTLIGVVFLPGTWPNSTSSPVETAEPAFVPQPTAVDSTLDVGQLLREISAELSASKAPWLAVKFHQTVRDGACGFSTRGVLQRGPAACARLELDLHGGHQPVKLTVVSDGEVLAQARKLGDGDPEITITRIPTSDKPRQTLILVNKGCGGPGAMLAQMAQHLQRATLTSGTLGEKAVTLIEGDLPGDSTPLPPGIRAKVRSCRIYLDARTRWPCRLEWWAATPSSDRRPLATLEYLDLEIGRQLSVQECKQMFSYRPESIAPKPPGG